MALKRQRITWMLILAYMVLRLPFLVGIALLAKERVNWLGPTFETGVYLMVAALIWWEVGVLFARIDR